MKHIKRIILSFMLVLALLVLVGCNLSTTTSNGPKIKISGDETVIVGETGTYTAEVTPTDKFSQDVTWDTSNNLLATISEEGVLTGLQTGRLTVRATYQDEEYKVIGRFSVLIISDTNKYTDETPTQLVLSLDSDPVINTKDVIRVETTPADASHDFIYSSSDEDVATIDNYGIVTYINVGEVTFTVKTKENEEIAESITMTVSNKTRSSDYEEAVVDCIASVETSVVGIANYQYNDRNVLEKKSLGSGFVYEAWGVLEDGTITFDLSNEGIVKYGYYLITNRHVVKDSDELKVYMFDIDDEIPAYLIQYDNKVDIAVVTFEFTEYIAPLVFADSDTLKSGQTVIAIGNPEGFEYSRSATAGIISYPIRFVSDDTDEDGINDWDAAYIQHDAPINPGNSGGPLFNLYGEVVGVNTMKFAKTDIDNMGFSIPSNEVVNLLPYLENGIVPERARIGVTVIAVRDLLASDYKNNSEYEYKIPDDVISGLYVSDVSEGSVAYGKIQADDIIMVFDGVDLKNSTQLRAILNSIVVGSNTEIEVVLLRNGEEVTVTLVW